MKSAYLTLVLILLSISSAYASIHLLLIPDLLLCPVACCVGALASNVEEQIIKQPYGSDWENSLLAAEWYKSGFIFCVGRRFAAVAALHLARERVTSLLVKGQVHSETRRFTFIGSRLSHVLLTLIRHQIAKKNRDHSELITGITNYWQRWSERIAAQQT